MDRWSFPDQASRSRQPSPHARTGLLIAQAAIDNLVKGASGQAIQCLNVRFGLPEGEGLAMPAMWP